MVLSIKILVIIPFRVFVPALSDILYAGFITAN